jgi:hypothetical protein
MQDFVRRFPDRSWRTLSAGDEWGVIVPSVASAATALFYPGTEFLAWGKRREALPKTGVREWLADQLQERVGSEGRLLTVGASYRVQRLGRDLASFWREQDQCVFTGAWIPREDLREDQKLAHTMADFVGSQHFGSVALLRSDKDYVLHLDAQRRFAPENLNLFEYWQLRTLYQDEWPRSADPWGEAARLKTHWLVQVQAEHRTRLFQPRDPREPSDFEALVALPTSPDGRVFMWLQRRTALDAWRNAWWTIAKYEAIEQLTLRDSGLLELSDGCEPIVRLEMAEGKVVSDSSDGAWTLDLQALRRRLLDTPFRLLRWTTELGAIVRRDTDFGNARQFELQYMIQRARCDDPQSLVLRVTPEGVAEPPELPELRERGVPSLREVPTSGDWMLVLCRWRTTFVRLTDKMSLQQAQALCAYVRHNFGALVRVQDEATSRQPLPLKLRWSGDLSLDLSLRRPATAFLRWLAPQRRLLQAPPPMSIAEVVQEAPEPRDTPRNDLVARIGRALKEVRPEIVRVALLTGVSATPNLEEACSWLQQHAGELQYVRLDQSAFGLLEMTPSARLGTRLWATITAESAPRLYAVTKNMVRELKKGAHVVEWTSFGRWMAEASYVVLNEDVYDREHNRFVHDAEATPWLQSVRDQRAALAREFREALETNVPEAQFLSLESEALLDTPPPTPFLALTGDKSFYANPQTYTLENAFDQLSVDELLYFHALRAKLDRLFTLPRLVVPPPEDFEADLESRKFLLLQLPVPKPPAREDDARFDFATLCGRKPPQEARRAPTSEGYEGAVRRIEAKRAQPSR